MKNIQDVITFLNEHIIECDKGTCGRCDDARKAVEILVEAEKRINGLIEVTKKYGDNRNKFIQEFSDWIKE